VPLFCPLVPETVFTQWHKILSQNTRHFKRSYGENPKSLSHLISKRYLVVSDKRTDRRTDRITVANTRYTYAGSRA